MALTVNTILKDASNRLWDPLQVRYPTGELIVWMNWAAKELAQDLEFQKKNLEFLGNTHIAALGTAPRFYDLPADFVMLDPNEGIKTNGLRRLATTAGELEIFQQKEIAGASGNETITVDDYFSQSFTGLIFHYSIDSVNEDRVAAGKSGFLLWFTPNPADADTIKMVYIMLPEAFTVGGAMTSRLIGATEEALVLGIMTRALQKALIAGVVSIGVFDKFDLLYERAKAKARSYYSAAKKQTDGPIRIKTAKQVYGMYNSARQ